MNIFQKTIGNNPKQTVVSDAKHLIEHCECSDWGENLVRVIDEEGNGYLVNKKTGKVRLIDSCGFLVGFSDEDIDFATLDKVPNSENAHTRQIEYANINRWDNCKKGLIALSWTLYPDGMYFADEDGFGMEPNNELTVYCIMDDDLNVIRPFTIVEDVDKLLKKLRKAK